MDTQSESAVSPAPSTRTRNAIERVRIVDYLKARQYGRLAAAYDESEGEVTEAHEDLEAELAELGEEQIEALGGACLFLAGLEAAAKKREGEIKAMRAKYAETREKLLARIGQIVGDGKAPTLATIKIRLTTSYSFKDAPDAPLLSKLPAAYREKIPATFKRDATGIKKAIRAGAAEGATKAERTLAKKLGAWGSVETRRSCTVKGC